MLKIKTIYAGLILVLALTSTAMAQTAPDLCQGMKGQDLTLCKKACTRLPAPKVCLLVLRFGARGGIAFVIAKQTGNDPAVVALGLGMSKSEAQGLKLYLDYDGVVPIVPIRLTGQARDGYEKARALNNKGFELSQKGRYEDALRYYNQALEIDKAVLGMKHPRTATTLNNIGAVYYNMGRYEDALQYDNQALAIDKAVLGMKHPRTATTLNNIGAVYAKMGRYEDALRYYNQALEIDKAVLGMKHPDTAGSLNNIGLVYYNMGRYEDALRYFKQALEIDKAVLGPRHPDTATTLNNIGGVYAKMGRYEDALRYYNQALEIFKAVLGMKHPHTAATLNNIGLVYWKMGRYEDALRYFKQALEIRKAVLGMKHPDTATTLNNIGEVYNSMGRYKDALKYLKQALEIFKAVLGMKHPLTAATLNNIGLVYAAMGHYDQTLRYLKQALEIEKAVLGMKHPSTATILNNIGLVYAAMGHYDQALRYYNKALKILEEALGPWHIHVALSLSDIAGLQWARGRQDLARQAMDRAIRIARNNFYENTLYSRKKRPLLWAMKVLKPLRYFYDLYINLFLNRPRRLMGQALVWQGAENTAAKVAFDMQRVRAELRKKHDAKGLALLNTYMEKRFEYMRLKMVVPAGKGKVLEANIRARDSAVKALKQDLQALEKRLAARSGEFRARRSVYMAGIDDACQVLRHADAALVVYVRYRVFDPKAKPGKYWKEWRYMALVMAPRGKGCQVKKVAIGGADKVDEVVKAYVKEMKRQVPMVARNTNFAAMGRRVLDKKGRKLAEVVLDPVMKLVPGHLGLFVCPDGALNEVNLGALPMGKDGQYLIEQRPVAYLSNPFQVLRMRFLWSKSDTDKGKGAFVGWSPDFDKGVCAIQEWLTGPARCKKLALKAWKTQTRQVFTASVNKGTKTKGSATMAGGGVCAYDVKHWRRLSGWGSVAKGIVKALGKAFGKSSVVYATGRSMIEEGLSGLLTGKRVVVLFTHGFFVDPKKCPQAAQSRDRGMLSIGGFGRKAQGPAVDPFRLSGLVLAGANQGAKVVEGVKDYLERKKYLPHDGLVTGRDIIEYDMRGTRLVVLDACDTSQGVSANGQSPLSIAHAFDVAGVRLTTTTLWEVMPDVASVVVQALVATMDQAKDQNQYRRALTWYQRAMKIVLKKYGLPVFWAAFTPLVGG